MKRHRVFLAFIICEVILIAGLVSASRVQTAASVRAVIPEKVALVRSLGLTDLSVWTEARYTRHPSQADFFSAFQDSPSAFEHFPAGSIVAPVQR